MINVHGTPNPGLKPVGTLTQGCQNKNFLTQSNSWFRETCTWLNDKRYCGYLFALYFQKDQYSNASSMDKDSTQKSNSGQNHRHDIEHVAVWTTDGAITHVGTSAHGKMHNHPISKVAKVNNNPAIVYHKDGSRTHAFRLAGKDELPEPENSSKMWQQLNVVDWYRVSPKLRQDLGGAYYHTATLEIKGTKEDFSKKMTGYKPGGYPDFTTSEAPGRVGAHLISASSQRCLEYGENTKSVQIWDCHYGLNQSWVIEENRIRAQNYNWCITAQDSGVAGQGKGLFIADCDGSERQKFRMIAGRLDLGGDQNFCGDIDHAKTKNGTKLISWPCHSGTNQTFEILIKK